MSRNSLAPLSLALAVLVGLAGQRAPAPPVVLAASVVAGTTSGSALAPAHPLLADVPAVEVNGDALSETAAAENAGQSRQEHRVDAPAVVSAGAFRSPDLARPFAALGRRAHPPTAPPRSA